MRRWAGSAIAVAGSLAAMLGAAPALAQSGLGLTEAKSPKFPQRAYILTLPEAQALSQSTVSVSENGESVDALKISRLGGQSAVVLVIDASKSMGRKMDDAMKAARAFADRRAPDQLLGVVFFSNKPVTALEPTADAAKIDAALANPPELPPGTKVYDAAASGVQMIEKAGVAAGSVIVLSDGADYRSVITRNELIDNADAARVRLFSVGIRSRSFDPVSLESLAVNGGEYVEAAQPGDLKEIFSRLAAQQGREFLVTYRSRQPLESNVAVAFSVSGVSDIVTDAYRTPDFPVPPALPDPPQSFWQSDVATAAAIGLFCLLIAFAVAMLFRPLRVSITRRIARFTGEPTKSDDEETTQRVKALLNASESWLSTWNPWIEFELDVELSKLKWSPRHIVIATLSGAVLLSLLFFLTNSLALAVIVLIGVPIAARIVIRYLATKTRRRFEDQLPDNLQVMASALRAGHSFIGALSVMVKDAPEPSRKEFRRVVQDEQLGIPVEDSLAVVNDRMRCDDVIYVGLIATLQRDTGGNTAEVLDKVVETMRERGKLRRLVRTLTAQGRLGGWIVTGLPIAMLVFLLLFKPHYLDPMLENTAGWVILIFAGCMVALGSYCIRRIVDIKV